MVTTSCVRERKKVDLWSVKNLTRANFILCVLYQVVKIGLGKLGLMEKVRPGVRVHLKDVGQSGKIILGKLGPKEQVDAIHLSRLSY